MIVQLDQHEEIAYLLQNLAQQNTTDPRMLYGQLVSTRISTAEFYAHAERNSHTLSIFAAQYKNLGTPFATAFLAYKALKGCRGTE